MKKLLERRDRFMGAATLHMEGEMSYHARHCEGGTSIFLVPQSALVYLIDHGRIIKSDSPYRNSLGETFSQKSAKWDNYLLNEETGGAQVMAHLKKSYMENRLPQMILQARASGEKVILRHAL